MEWNGCYSINLHEHASRNLTLIPLFSQLSLQFTSRLFMLVPCHFFFQNQVMTQKQNFEWRTQTHAALSSIKAYFSSFSRSNSFNKRDFFSSHAARFRANSASCKYNRCSYSRCFFTISILKIFITFANSSVWGAWTWKSQLSSHSAAAAAEAEEEEDDDDNEDDEEEKDKKMNIMRPRYEWWFGGKGRGRCRHHRWTVQHINRTR